jgi:hypothetical protein
MRTASLRSISSCCAALLLAVAPAVAAPSTGAPKPTVAARFSVAVAKAGIKRCAPIVTRVAEFLIETGDAGFSLKSLGRDPDTSPVLVTLESAHAGFGTTRYATIVVIPKESCSGYYEQTIFWAKPCAKLKQENFANFPVTKPLLRNVQASAASPTVSLYLMPAGAGCVSMKKEAFQ